MNSKITLEKFRQYKEKIMETEYSYDENEAFLRCFNLQKEILKYDLSDIPFEEWEGMTIYADNENRAFFSGTNANIDFNLVEYFGNAEFHGCNIKNLEKIDNYINSNDFDDYIIKKNKNLFLVGNFDDSFKEKFYSFLLTIDDILNLNHKGKIVVRISVNPEEIIKKVEFGTSRLKGRIEAINKLAEADYPIGILIAPVILVDNWKELYSDLIKYLYENLSNKAKKSAFFEIIFMTYSYVHRAINTEAFPSAIDLYNKQLMTGRGRGKYMYKNYIREEGEVFLREEMKKYFPDNEIMYVV